MASEEVVADWLFFYPPTVIDNRGHWTGTRALVFLPLEPRLLPGKCFLPKESALIHLLNKGFLGAHYDSTKTF